MRKCNSLLLGLSLAGAVSSGQAQGNFQNLGFESASLVAAGGFYVQFAPAFPGWTGTVGGVQQTLALSNTIYLDSSGISIINSNYNPVYATGGVIQGNYTAILQAGLGPEGTPADTSLSQTGLVPANAQSLQFEAFLAVGGGSTTPFAVTLGGQTLFLVPLANDANYTLYGADISSWAGQTEQLSFTVFAENPHRDDQYLFLDAIQFSSQFVPEPGVVGLSVLGALVLGWRVIRLRRRRYSCELVRGHPRN